MSQKRNRQRVADVAARLIVESGISDFQSAKTRAAESLGISTALPNNNEIEAALVNYQRLFGGQAHERRVHELRQQALDAMDYFVPFKPLLTGSVLSGAVNAGSDINLHVFADSAKDIALFLHDHQIPFDNGDKRFGHPGSHQLSYPCFSFVAGDTTVELVLFPTAQQHHAPPTMDGSPMTRLSRDKLAALLNTDD